MKKTIKVRKKNKKIEDFDINKIKKSIKSAAKEANLSPKEAESLAQKISNSVSSLVSKKKEINTSQIRDLISKKLDATAKDVLVAWKDFEKRKHNVKMETSGFK